MSQTDSFKVLDRFLGLTAPEVEGRAASEPSAALRRLLRKFANGELTEEERARVVGQLEQHPEWLANLAAEVKGLRVSPKQTNPDPP